MRHAIAAVGTAIGLAVSYGFARLGEPSSERLWCQMLQLCN